MLKRIMSMSLVILSTMFWIFTAQAQEQANDGAADLVMITPKPGQEDALEAAIAEYHHWMGDKPGAFHYMWFQVETGPNTGKYIARSGDHNWADFDQEFDWEDEAGEKFASDVLPLIDHAERMLTEDMPEFDNWPEDMSGYTLYQVENWYVKAGQYGKFRAGLEKIHKALSEGGFPRYYGFSSTVSGGKGNEITIVLPMKGYADYSDPDPSFFDIVSEALGGPDAFAEFMSDWGSTYHAGESFLVRYMPEASDYGDSE